MFKIIMKEDDKKRQTIYRDFLEAMLGVPMPLRSSVKNTRGEGWRIYV